MAADIGVEFILQNSLQAVLIIAYLAYELRMGRGKQFMRRLDNVTLVLLAVVEEMDDVDTAKARERLERESPDDVKNIERNGDTKAVKVDNED